MENNYALIDLHLHLDGSLSLASVKGLAAEGITLELCPTSNLNTSIFESYAAYPLRKLMAAGVKVTVNTDNMTVSNTTVAEELKHLDLVKEEMYLLAKNAVEAAFADAETKEWLKEEVEKRFL